MRRVWTEIETDCWACGVKLRHNVIVDSPPFVVCSFCGTERACRPGEAADIDRHAAEMRLRGVPSYVFEECRS